MAAARPPLLDLIDLAQSVAVDVAFGRISGDLADTANKMVSEATRSGWTVQRLRDALAEAGIPVRRV
jgi:hypothetical protein